MRQERAERTKSALVLAAASLFDGVGYECTTLFQVSSLAAVSKGALSFHFANKADLADAVQSLAVKRASTRIRELRSRDLPALQNLIDLTHLIAHQRSQDEVIRACEKLDRELHAEREPRLSALWRAELHDIAREAERESGLASGLGVHAVASMAYAVSTRHLSADVDVHEEQTGLWQLVIPQITAVNSPWPLWPQGTEDFSPSVPSPRTPQPEAQPA
ncbi:TetR family transcriptional regulator [Streptomyces daliensis]|uniref:TetR/AcrR family transcriptional regulator n=1 Tax=Streptomyces daliensis TaxID=299421 RepID=A0A8T4IVE2_9ACTN|nr:TetR/AcrR family transcriptional regulator [Streptomyces daliensis]